MKTTQERTTETICLAPIAGCLIAAEKRLNDTAWKASNDQQNHFLTGYYAEARNEVCALPEVESMASEKAAEINEFLTARGFNIQLPEFSQNPPSFGVASVFKLLLKWTRPGHVTYIKDGKYPAVRLEKGIEFFKSGYVENPIVSIRAKNGDEVFMTVSDDPPNGSKLLRLINNISTDIKPTVGFEDVIFPMITYDEMVDISWIQGMEIAGKSGPWLIECALQQTKFRMNEVGAKVESAVAMGIRYMYCGAPPPPLIIDQPFLLWIKRSGLSQPLFVAYFTEKYWERPGSL